MTHPVYVCLEHKLTMHTARNVGIHCNTKHGMWYGDAEKQGIVVQIGTCDPTQMYFGRCPSPKDQPATEFDLKYAKETLAKKGKEGVKGET